MASPTFRAGCTAVDAARWRTDHKVIRKISVALSARRQRGLAEKGDLPPRRGRLHASFWIKAGRAPVVRKTLAGPHGLRAGSPKPPPGASRPFAGGHGET